MSIAISYDIGEATSTPAEFEEMYAPYLTIVLTANVGYKFTSAQITIMYMGMYDQPTFVLSENDTVATLNHVLSYDFWDIGFISVTADTTATAPSINIPIELSLEHAIAVESPTHITNENHDSFTIVLQADTGYGFSDGVSFSIYNPNEGTWDSGNFTLSENDTIATLIHSIPLTHGDSVFNVIAIAYSTAPPFEGYGAVNIYIADNDILSQFANERYVIPSVTQGAELIDLGSYIHNIFRIYGTITQTTNEIMKLGNYNTNIPVTSPLQTTLEIDCGKVTIPFKNNSSLDYQADIQLFLPFVGFVSVDVAYLGEEINLKYVIDIPTGEGVAILSNNGIGVQFIECTPSTDVIYNVNKSDVDTIGGSNWSSGYLLGLQPYVTVKWFQSTNENIRFNDSKRKLIGDVQGYAEIDEIDGLNSVNINATDKENIINLLNSGIYVS